jgi:hypothetical protein
MKTLNFYEFAGLVAPGGVTLFGIALLFPTARGILFGNNLSVGEFGLFTILAFVAGHLVQGIGDVIEWFWWKAWGGMPTDWVRTGKHELIASQQRQALATHIHEKLKLKGCAKFEEMSRSDWSGITRQIYAAVAAGERSARVDRFNGNYGLNRGITAALVIISALMFAFRPAHWSGGVLIFLGVGLALFRMHDFGRRYGSELFVQFLQLPKIETERSEK